MGGGELPRLMGTHRPQEADINYKWLARAGLDRKTARDLEAEQRLS